jgi:hypothetical protein
VHLFDFLQQSFASLFVMIQALAQLNPEPISPEEMANLWQSSETSDRRVHMVNFIKKRKK